MGASFLSPKAMTDHYRLCEHKPKLYRHKDYSFEIFLKADEQYEPGGVSHQERQRFLYTAFIELPNSEGVISTCLCSTREEAELTAKHLIDEWSSFNESELEVR